ncbi:MAG: UTP--glucose-1-phosphate uridylyltransferase [Oligoflexia bacterium]|nr:UTP--glucose-1-phosphate uridylyltransferase [Oligoflexia bacterium]MBF0364851.1 UTP--glucose-1-phosphate uridylyltransferase [Oligoflexia bacterium]
MSEKDPQRLHSFTEEMNTLFQNILSYSPLNLAPHELLVRFQEFLGLDDLNFSYFMILLHKKQSSGKSIKYKIYEGEADNSSSNGNLTTAYPVSNAPEELLQFLPVADYRGLLENAALYREQAKRASLWPQPMQAGLGSSIERKRYLAEKLNISESQVQLGPKGTDLFLNCDDENISLAEVQIMRAIEEVARGEWKEVVFSNVVSGETDKAMQAIWQKRARVADNHENLSYLDYVSQSQSLRLFKQIYQSYLPTFDATGALTIARMAPGGHAIFGISAIRAAFLEGERPEAKNSSSDGEGEDFDLVGVISNGEDLSGLPDPVMVGYMLQNRLPILMVTTEKTGVDLKGGQLALVKERDAENDLPSVTIIEKAQAEESGQLKLFEELGLRSGDRPAMFNTNMALFNYRELEGKMKKLISKVGMDGLLEIVAPDVIENWKTQKCDNGGTNKFLQLEGAMGSVLLNLDRYWREHFGGPIVNFINVDSYYRTNFFSPIKSAFDYFMQFHSDRFSFDKREMRIKNNRPESALSASLADPFYQDVSNVLEAFQNCSILGLDHLSIEGTVLLQGLTLRGKIKIISSTSTPQHLRKLLLSGQTCAHDDEGRPILENLTISIASDNTLKLH